MSETPNTHCRHKDAVALYALGALDVAEALDLEAHLPTCGACRDELALRRDDAADLSLAAEPIEPPVELLARLRERIRGQDEQGEVASNEEAAPAGQPWRKWKTARAEGLSFALASEAQWEPTGVDGVEARRLYADTENHRITMMVRMQPGSSYPAHHHGGDEECYVVEGDLDVGGTIMRAGDYQFAPAGTEHPVQSTEEGCLLLIVTSDADEFSG